MNSENIDRESSSQGDEFEDSSQNISSRNSNRCHYNMDPGYTVLQSEFLIDDT